MYGLCDRCRFCDLCVLGMPSEGARLMYSSNQSPSSRKPYLAGRDISLVSIWLWFLEAAFASSADGGQRSRGCGMGGDSSSSSLLKLSRLVRTAGQ